MKKILGLTLLLSALILTGCSSNNPKSNNENTKAEIKQETENQIEKITIPKSYFDFVGTKPEDFVGNTKSLKNINNSIENESIILEVDSKTKEDYLKEIDESIQTFKEIAQIEDIKANEKNDDIVISIPKDSTAVSKLHATTGIPALYGQKQIFEGKTEWSVKVKVIDSKTNETLAEGTAPNRIEMW